MEKLTANQLFDYKTELSDISYKVSILWEHDVTKSLKEIIEIFAEADSKQNNVVQDINLEQDHITPLTKEMLIDIYSTDVMSNLYNIVKNIIIDELIGLIVDAKDWHKELYCFKEEVEKYLEDTKKEIDERANYWSSDSYFNEKFSDVLYKIDMDLICSAIIRSEYNAQI